MFRAAPLRAENVKWLGPRGTSCSRSSINILRSRSMRCGPVSCWKSTPMSSINGLCIVSEDPGSPIGLLVCVMSIFKKNVRNAFRRSRPSWGTKDAHLSGPRRCMEALGLAGMSRCSSVLLRLGSRRRRSGITRARKDVSTHQWDGTTVGMPWPAMLSGG